MGSKLEKTTEGLQYVKADNCPADAIREYIEEIIHSHKEKLKEKEVSMPKEIILSPKNMEFLINSKFVDYIGAGETENEATFYWEKTNELPALELRVKRRKDGLFEVTYMKEEAGNNKGEFVWEKDNKEKTKDTMMVFRKEDALEDIYDMDR